MTPRIVIVLRFCLMSSKLLIPLNVSLLLLFLFGAPAPARAQHMNEPDSPCAGVAVTSDLVDCLAKAKDKADAELNSVYMDLRKRLDGSDLKHLIEAQRIWISYRDANCSAERELYDGGTGAFPAYLACVEGMTRARTKELHVTYAVRLK